MDSVRKNLKIAGTINIIFGIITLPIIIYSAFMIITGIILHSLSTKTENEIIDSRKKLIALAIICIPLNLVTSIILFASIDKIKLYEKVANGINAPPEGKKVIIKKKVIDPEVKKIDILLKLGVGMVFVSGILFATTTWSFISDITKAIVLIMLGMLFLGLSRFSEKKLKLYNTTFMYWILSMSFFLLTIVGMLYFGIAGEYLTYGGEGHLLAKAITLFTIAGLSFSTYLKFSNKTFIYATYTGVLFTLTTVMAHLNVPNMLIILTISAIILLINILSTKETTLFKFSNCVSYVMIIFIFKQMFTENRLIIFITCLFNIINLSYLTMFNKDNEKSIISLIMSNILLLIGIYNLDLSNGIDSIIIFLITSAHVLLIKFKLIDINKKYDNCNYIAYSIIYLITCFATTSCSEIIPLLISLAYMLINYVSSKEINDSKILKISMFLEPLSIFIFTGFLLDQKIFNLDTNIATIFVATTIISCIIHYLTKNSLRKKIYLPTIIIEILLFYCAFIFDNNEYQLIIILLPNIYNLFATLKNNNKTEFQRAVSYIVLLYGIYNILTITNIFDINTIISSIIFIWILAIILYLSSDNIIKKVTYFAISLPIFDIIDELSFDYNLRQIMISILILYITFVVVRIICKNDNSKNILGVIGIIVSTLDIIFTTDLIVGLYIGLLGIAVTMLGYYKKEFKSFFITGIIITVVNIFIQLSELWEKIPFWLYLLVVGLGLIFFVTYKEMKKMNKK